MPNTIEQFNKMEGSMEGLKEELKAGLIERAVKEVKSAADKLFEKDWEKIKGLTKEEGMSSYQKGGKVMEMLIEEYGKKE